jgi:hypothetical protein
MAIKFDTFKTGGGSAPTGGLVYKGSYDAATQSPNLTTSLKGDFYIVSVAGALATIPLNVGDHIVFNQNASSPITSAMFDVIDNTDAVASVNSQTGVVVLDSDNISEGSTNLYFTSARFDTELGTKTTTDLSEGVNLYHTDARVDARIALATANDLSDVDYTAGAGIDGYVMKYNNTTGNWEAQAESAGGVTSVNGDSGPAVVLDSDDLAEGATNLFYTDARFDTRLATKTTSDLTEGANLYHTDARVDARIAAATANDLSDVSYTAGAGIDGYVMTYNNTTGNWEAAAAAGGAVGTLQQVTDQGSTTTTNISVAQVTMGGDLLADGVLTRTIGDETNRFITAHADLNGAVRFKAKAGVALSKGDVVYISGVSGGVPVVQKAQANSASTMPAFGLCYASASLNADVQIVTLGNLDGINTGSFSLGNTLYVSETTAGALTSSAPTGESNLIQNIAKVVKVDGTGNSGIYKVGGAGRTAATPNLDSNKIFLGNGSNQAVSTALSSVNLSSFNQDLTTTNVSEGTNLYYTDARFDTRLATKTTTDLSEGANLYHTDARVDARIALATANDLSDVSYTAGAGIDGYVMTYNNTTGNWEAQATSSSNPTVTSASPSSAYTISTHAGIEEIYILTPSADISVNLPSASSCGSGYKYQIKNMASANTLTIDPNGTETIDGSTTFVLNVQYQSITLITNGSNWFII